jgi:Short C-terminal domain/Phospholipase_D-nuclease N-terminal
MVLATDYPFLNIFWTMLIFFAWVIWIWMVIVVLANVFSRHDLSGWGKAAWTIFIIVLPFLGVLTYLIAEHKKLEAAGGLYGRRGGGAEGAYVSGDDGAAGQIEKAKQLLDSGAITQQEFETLKARALTAS